ncbi:MAG: AsmA family protein [Pseudomonadota bacterium]
MIWLKRVFSGIFVVLLLAVGALAVFVASFDANRYKPLIVEQAKAHTGRELQINGDLSLSIYPWLGLRVQNVVLGNAPGFAAPEMARLRELGVRARLLPLLSGRLEADTLLLDGLELNLERAADGRDNWSDLRGAKAGAEEVVSAPQTASASPALGAFSLGGVEVREARVLLVDAQGGQEVRLEGLDLSTGPLVPGEPVALHSAGELRLAGPGLRARFELDSRAGFDPASTRLELGASTLKLLLTGEGGGGLPTRLELTATLAALRHAIQEGALEVDGLQVDVDSTGGPLSYARARIETRLRGNVAQGQYRAEPLRLAGDFKGVPTPRGELPLAIDTALTLDLKAQTLALEAIKLVSGPVTASGQLQLRDVLGRPVGVGRIDLPETDLRALAAHLGYRLPQATDAQALSRVAFSSELKLESARLLLDKLALVLDGQVLRGWVGIVDRQGGRAGFALAGDRLDVDRYLPPPAPSAGKGAPGGVGGARSESKDEPLPLPVELLRGLDLDGRVQLGALRVRGMELHRIDAALEARKGALNLRLSLDAFEGRTQTVTWLDVREASPEWATQGQVSDVALQPMLQALMNEDRLLGKGDLRFDLRTRGDRPSQLKGQLNGKGDFALRDGAIKGFNIAYSLRKAEASLKGSPTPPAEKLETDFSRITASFAARDGVIDNRDLRAASPLLRVEGAGTVDIGREVLDYVATVIVVNTATGQGGKALEELKQVPVPIALTGPFADPKIGLDLGGILRAKAEQKAKERINEELQKRLGDKLGLPGTGAEKDGAPSAPQGAPAQGGEEAIKGLLKGLGF